MTLREDVNGVLAFAHIGDLHITDADQSNFIELMSILVQLETQAKNQLDFVVLPGDCADNGLPNQYALIATALRMLSLPAHIIPGDHDMEQGDLSNFYDGLPADMLPYGLSLKGLAVFSSISAAPAQAVRTFASATNRCIGLIGAA